MQSSTSKRSASSERRIRVDGELIKHLLESPVKNDSGFPYEKQIFEEILNGWKCFNKKNDKLKEPFVNFTYFYYDPILNIEIHTEFFDQADFT